MLLKNLNNADVLFHNEQQQQYSVSFVISNGKTKNNKGLKGIDIAISRSRYK